MADHHSDHHAEDNPAAHVDNVPNLLVIYVCLIAGCIATIGVSMAGLGDQSIYIHMAISTVQAVLVLYYFMHLKRSDALTWLTIGSAFFFMLILFALPLSDFLTRKWGAL